MIICVNLALFNLQSVNQSNTFVHFFSFATSYLDSWVQQWTGVPPLRMVRQHLQPSFHPCTLTTVVEQHNCVCVSVCIILSYYVSVFCSCIWGLGVRFHPDSRGSRGGGTNICSKGQEQKHWHVSLFTEMTFPPLRIPVPLPAAVLLSASLPQAQLKMSARISLQLPKSSLTKCQDYIFLCSHRRL